MLFVLIKLCYRILSNWALRGDFNDMDTGMFIQLKPKIEDEEINIRRDWNRFIIDDSIEIPVFFEKYKIDILQCGKTINFFNRFNDLVRNRVVENKNSILYNL